MTKKWFDLVGLAVLVAAFGCGESSVGDPCIPENVPAGGFLSAETYLETSSVQCASRVCLVREVDGDPNNVEPECPLGAETCVAPGDIERGVYCTVRCAAPAGSGLPTQGCPGGFTCTEILETGGDGLRGSYCVRDPIVIEG